jgi:hypothetical protein
MEMGYQASRVKGASFLHLLIMVPRFSEDQPVELENWVRLPELWECASRRKAIYGKLVALQIRGARISLVWRWDDLTWLI